LLRASKQSKSKTRYIPFNSLRFALKKYSLRFVCVHIDIPVGVPCPCPLWTWNMTMPMTRAMTLTMHDNDHGHDHVHIGFPRNEIFRRKEMAYHIRYLFRRNEVAKRYISPNNRTKQINYLSHSSTTMFVVFKKKLIFWFISHWCQISTSNLTHCQLSKKCRQIVRTFLLFRPKYAYVLKSVWWKNVISMKRRTFSLSLLLNLKFIVLYLGTQEANNLPNKWFDFYWQFLKAFGEKIPELSNT
jgi:hypothetical protein